MKNLYCSLLLFIICLCTYPTHAQNTWIDSDWSVGTFSLTNVERSASPGELVLKSKKDSLVVFLQTNPLLPVYPSENNLRKKSIFAFLPYSVEPHRFYYAMSSTLDGGCYSPGHPDPPSGCEFAEMHYYDLISDEWDTVRGIYYPVDAASGNPSWNFPEPATLRIKEINGRIIIPSNDNLTSATRQNIYEYEPNTGWRRHFGVINCTGGHLSDIEYFQGRYYACGGQNSANLYSYPTLALVAPDTQWDEVWPPDFFVGSGKLTGMAVYQNNLFIKASVENWIYQFNGTTWTKKIIPGLSSTALDDYAAFEIWNNQLWMISNGRISRLNGANNSWENMGGAPVTHMGTAPSGFRFLNDTLYISGGIDQGSPNYNYIYTAEVWKSYQGNPNTWQRVANNFVPAELQLKLPMLNFWHGRMFISDGRSPNAGLHPRIHAAKCVNSGTLISQPHDFATAMTSGTISWDMINVRNTQVKFRIRSATSQAGLGAKQFMGPTGIYSYYTMNNSAINPAYHINDTWFQYEVTLVGNGNGRLTPILKEVIINISGNGQAQPPSTPTGLAGNAWSPGGIGQVNLTWTANPSQQNVTSYVIYQAINNANGPYTYSVSVPAPATSFTLSAPAGPHYYYKILARNAQGSSPLSAYSLAHPQADFNNDWIIPGTLDLATFVAANGSRPGYPNWNAKCDLNNSQSVDLGDFSIFQVWYNAVPQWLGPGKNGTENEEFPNQLRLRSANTIEGLSAETFVGYTGTIGNYYTFTSGNFDQLLLEKHAKEQWHQYEFTNGKNTYISSPIFNVKVMGDAHISIYPQPAKDELYINYQLTEGATVSLEIFNLLGEKIILVNNERQDIGIHNYSFNINQVSNVAGMHFVRLTAGSHVYAERFIKED